MVLSRVTAVKQHGTWSALAESQPLENTKCRWHRTSLGRFLTSVKPLSHNREIGFYSRMWQKISRLRFFHSFLSPSMQIPLPNTVTTQWLTGTLCTTWFNIQQFSVLPTQCIYVLCMDQRTNRDYFPIQH